MQCCALIIYFAELCTAILGFQGHARFWQTCSAYLTQVALECGRRRSSAWQARIQDQVQLDCKSPAQVAFKTPVLNLEKGR